MTRRHRDWEIRREKDAETPGYGDWETRREKDTVTRRHGESDTVTQRLGDTEMQSREGRTDAETR